MKRILLLLGIFFLWSTAAAAQEIFRCVDAGGNAVLTSVPQEGMKCSRGESSEEPQSRRTSSKTNLPDTCSNLSRELEEVSNDINALERQRTALQKKQLDLGKNETLNNSGSRRRFEKPAPLRDEMTQINSELSVLHRKQSLIHQDIRLYKCIELNRDLSNVNEGKPETYRSRTYRIR